MTNVNATPNVTAPETPAPRPTRVLSAPRWTSRPSAPRLISFGRSPLTSPRTRR